MEKMSRKGFGGVMAATLLTPVLTARVEAQQEPQANGDKFAAMHSGKRPEIAMLLYPGMTLMDMLGPQTALSTSCNVHLVWKNRDTLVTDSGVHIQADMTFADCPKNLDAIFVGGGPGQLAVMQDPECLRFLADRGSRAKYVTSVCSGSLIMGAAGLMRGYKATSHWAARDMLPYFGATPIDARVVVDRNRISGGGVTAGLDFGLTLLAKLLGEDIAKMTQLAMEYDPHPPYDAGTPKKAGPEITGKVMGWLGDINEKMRQTCVAAGKSMPK